MDNENVLNENDDAFSNLFNFSSSAKSSSYSSSDESYNSAASRKVVPGKATITTKQQKTTQQSSTTGVPPTYQGLATQLPSGTSNSTTNQQRSYNTTTITPSLLVLPNLSGTTNN